MQKSQDERVPRGTKLALGLTGFANFPEYARELAKTPQNLVHRTLQRRQIADFDEARVYEGQGFKKVLGPIELISFGIGMMIGAGIFVTTGMVSASLAGPSVTISYAVAGVSAFLSAFCYAEFAADLPFAGGAYNFISASLGQFLAWVCVANLILSYTLSCAGAIRNFSPNFAALCGQNEQFFTTAWNGYVLDWWAFAICLLLAVLLIRGTKESSILNLWTTIVHVSLLVFIIIAGFTQSNIDNTQPLFLPDQGVRGMFNGASIVFFSYIGFDAVANAGEEVRNVRDLPLGIIGAMVITTTLYLLVAIVLVFMVPNEALASSPTLNWAFYYIGQDWAKYIVSSAACLGIITTTLIGMYATSRVITAVARDHLLPPYLARLHPSRQTPWVALLVLGVTMALISLFTKFASVLDMVSISTLFVYWIVAVGLLWRHGYVHGRTTPKQATNLAGHILLVIAGSLGLSISYQTVDGWIGLTVSGSVILCAAISYRVYVPEEYMPPRFRVPLFPYLPIASIVLNTFLLGQMPPGAYKQFAIWMAVCVAIYVLYGMPASNVKDAKHSRPLPQHLEPSLKDRMMSPLEEVSEEPPSMRHSASDTF